MYRFSCYEYQTIQKHLWIYIYLQISISTTGLVLYGVCFVGFIIIVVFLLFCGITFNNRTPIASQKKAKGNGGRVERPRMFNICHADNIEKGWLCSFISLDCAKDKVMTLKATFFTMKRFVVEWRVSLPHYRIG